MSSAVTQAAVIKFIREDPVFGRVGADPRGIMRGAVIRPSPLHALEEWDDLWTTRAVVAYGSQYGVEPSGAKVKRAVALIADNARRAALGDNGRRDAG